MIRKLILFLFILVGLILASTLAVYFLVRNKPRLIPQFIFPAQQTKIFEFDTSPFIEIDYGKQIATGSPLIFGGAHAPNLEHQDAWDKIAEVGVTIIRRDFYIEYEVPQNITLSDYKNNVNDVQNPDTWNKITNWTNITITNQIYENVKKRGMKVMGILSFAPAWLTYSGTNYGVPKDWDVYEDIVKKLYKIHRPYLDFIEIWNEPDGDTFLDVSSSPYTKEQAYELIYSHAVKMIREIDAEAGDGRNIPIGGPVLANPSHISFLESLLQHKDNIDFISFHHYGDQIPSINSYDNLLRNYQKTSIPVYLTEWNSSDSYKTSRYTNLAISYTGSRLLSFLNMGLPMANYYALRDLNRSKYPNDDPSFAFYKWENGKAELLPQAKTWRLLSKSMGLGKGTSRIFNTQYSITSAAGFENIFGQRGMVVVNDEDEETMVNVTISNVPKNKSLFAGTDAEVYIASVDYDGGSVVEKIPVEVGNGTIQFTLRLPAQSVVGIIFQNTNVLEEFISNIPILNSFRTFIYQPTFNLYS